MQLRYAIFGESHGPAIGVVVENLPAGIPVEMDFIRRELNRRRARAGGLSTTRLEGDEPEILSGVFEGKTTGAERLRMLEKKRAAALDEIHFKERQLQRLDYLRHEIRKTQTETGGK